MSSEAKTRARRKHHLKEKYGISVEEYQAQLDHQNGVCAICSIVLGIY